MRNVSLIKHFSLNRIITFRRMKCISKIKPTNTQKIPQIIKVILLLPRIISAIQLVNHILWPITTIAKIPSLISWFSLKDSTAQIDNNLWIFLHSEKKNKKEKKISCFFSSCYLYFFFLKVHLISFSLLLSVSLSSFLVALYFSNM